MDANKRLKLLEIGYQIKPACGMCLHGDFRGDDDFGTCEKQTYQHLKHVGSPRQLSVLKYGSCFSYEPDQQYEAYIHIDAVMEAQSDLVKVVATLKQILCVKG